MKCEYCKWLTGEMHSIGIECTNPNRVWHTRLAHIKMLSDTSCKLFEEGENNARKRRKSYQFRKWNRIGE